MKYTVKQLAEYSGVSARTLRFYDQIGLLSPAFYSESGYRYYSENELLILQQILFFRELGFHLNDIKKIVLADNFNLNTSLKMHKNHLIQKIKNLNDLVTTVDMTIDYIEEKAEMKDKEFEMFRNFKKHAEMSNYLKENVNENIENLLEEIKENTLKLSKADIKKMEKETKEWSEELKQLIIKHSSHSSKAVQDIIARFCKRYQQFCHPTSSQIIELVKAEVKHPEMKKHFESIHPEFAEFYLNSVIFYAEKKLKNKRENNT